MIRLTKGNDSDTKSQELVADVDTLDAWRVVLFNDDVHTFDEVIFQIIKAVRCTRSIAEKHTWEVHNTGHSIVYVGEMSNCIRVSAVLEEIALKTEIQTG
ncbi:MAG: ATP-dependent Clp protease adaptor ClpS [Chlorobaculum sp.]|nr:ATP-dependent Clp protease adaptor ClpS [Chlorobaculum sp.]